MAYRSEDICEISFDVIFFVAQVSMGTLDTCNDVRKVCTDFYLYANYSEVKRRASLSAPVSPCISRHDGREQPEQHVCARGGRGQLVGGHVHAVRSARVAQERCHVVLHTYYYQQHVF